MSKADHKGIEPKCATCGNTVNLVFGRPCPVCNENTVKLYCLDHEGYVSTVPCPVCTPGPRAGAGPNDPAPAAVPAPAIHHRTLLGFALGAGGVALGTGLAVLLMMGRPGAGSSDTSLRVVVPEPGQVASALPAPAPSPVPSATPFPSPTPVPSPTPFPSPTPWPSPTPEPTPEIVEVPGFDAAAQARERADQRRRAEEARQNLLAAARKAYDECAALEKDQYATAEDRAAAWTEYASRFEKAGYELAYARGRAEFWRTWTAPTPVVATAPIAARTNAPAASTGQRSSDGRYIISSTGVITDTTTRLQWIVGPDRDTSYHDAVAWVRNCTVDGGGWRMPRQTELKALRIVRERTYNIDGVFGFTGWRWVWAEERDSWSAWSFHFSSGSEHWYRRSDSSYRRVLGVRASPRR